LVLEGYITDHFGAHAQDFTREVLNRIVTMGYKKWTVDLKSRLAEQFPDRRALYL